MTEEQKRTKMSERNDAICAHYLQGHKLSECASKFRLGRQRILQVLQKAGVWKPYVKNARTQWLGVTVTEEAKVALQREATRRGTSMSALTSDLIEGLREKERS